MMTVYLRDITNTEFSHFSFRLAGDIFYLTGVFYHLCSFKAVFTDFMIMFVFGFCFDFYFLYNVKCSHFGAVSVFIL